MTILVGVLRFINLFCAGISTGGLVFMLVAVVPMWHTVSHSTSAMSHKAIDHNAERYMPYITGVSGLAALVILILHYNLSQMSGVFTALGIVGTLGIVITSQFFNTPLNRAIKRWTPDTVPDTYLTIRSRWERLNVIRTSSA